MRHLCTALRKIAGAALIAAIGGCSPAAQTQSSVRAADSTLSCAPVFDEVRAFQMLKDQVALGPRVPGTAGHTRGLQFILRNVEPYADEVHKQAFAAALDGRRVVMTNVIARFNPQADKHILLAAHWDTRPTADMEVTPDKRRQPIPGANDGASGVAVLLELARTFHQRAPGVGVVMVFFDGEDYGPGMDKMFLGSKHFASQLDTTNAAPRKRDILYGILLDMVGDANLEIPKETHSLRAAPAVLNRIWSAARELAYQDIFTETPGAAILDDHVPLIEAGVKCVDLIDFNYGPWHTLDDTPDKCSPKSLLAVGKVVAAVVYSERPHSSRP